MTAATASLVCFLSSIPQPLAMLPLLFLAALVVGQAPCCLAARPFSERLADALIRDHVAAAAEAMALALRVRRGSRRYEGQSSARRPSRHRSPETAPHVPGCVSLRPLQMQASQRAAVAGALSTAFQRGGAEQAAASLSMAGAPACGCWAHVAAHRSLLRPALP